MRRYARFEVGDRVIWCDGFSGEVTEVLPDDHYRVKFDDGSEGVHDFNILDWRKVSVDA